MDAEGTAARLAMGENQSLLAREAGYSVAAKCLKVQAEAQSNDPALRTSDNVWLSKEAWSWYQGAIGEIEVGRLLKSLDSSWRVLHSVPIGSRDTDVDHILVGPNGVFVLNTKHHVERSIWVGDVAMMVGKDKKHYLRQARSENQNVAKRLASKVGFPVMVHSAIVVVGESSIKDIRPLDDRPTAVMSSGDLLQWITAQPATASPTQLELIRLAAEQPDTWHVDPHRADNLRAMQRFERLREAVKQRRPQLQKPRLHVVRPGEKASVSRATSQRQPASQSRTSPRTRRGRTTLSNRRIDDLAKAIVALAAVAVILTMTNNGTWGPFVMGLVSALNPALASTP